MKTKPSLLLLPGMDGTGELLSPILPLLDPHYAVRVAEYPPDTNLTYHELAEFCAKLLKRRQSTLVVAESFSGPVGVLLTSQQSQCSRLVLCASFSQSPWPGWIPRPLQGWARNLIKCGPIPPSASLAPMTLGQWSTPEHQHQIASAVAKVAPHVLRERLMMALSVDITHQARSLTVPVLYQQATHDRLVEAKYSEIIKKVCPNITHHMIEGPHFLMQVNPKECARSIIEWDLA